MTELKYIFFGNTNEMYGAHIVNAKPDFDQIAKIEPTKELVTHLMSNAFVEVKFSEMNNGPLEAGSTLMTEAKLSHGYQSIGSTSVIDVLYTEFNDLSF